MWPGDMIGCRDNVLTLLTVATNYQIGSVLSQALIFAECPHLCELLSTTPFQYKPIKTLALFLNCLSWTINSHQGKNTDARHLSSRKTECKIYFINKRREEKKPFNFCMPRTSRRFVLQKGHQKSLTGEFTIVVCSSGDVSDKTCDFVGREFKFLLTLINQYQCSRSVIYYQPTQFPSLVRNKNTKNNWNPVVKHMETDEGNTLKGHHEAAWNQRLFDERKTGVKNACFAFFLNIG